METLFYIIVFTLIGSVASIIGGVILLYKEKIAIRISHLTSGNWLRGQYFCLDNHWFFGVFYIRAYNPLVTPPPDRGGGV